MQEVRFQNAPWPRPLRLRVRTCAHANVRMYLLHPLPPFALLRPV